ncbi:MAG: hypothetical protein ACRENP_24335, partial [Longimicrobiales bacterium]
TGEGIESYRTITGTNVQDAIGESIGRTFRRGHWFGGGTSDGERITVGTSSSSKVWSNKRGQVPELVGWCDAIAQKLNSDRPVRTGRGIDHLPVGREVTALPPNIVRADWASGLYLSPVDLVWVAADGNRQVSILDCDLSIESQADDALTFRIENELVLWRGTFSYRTQSLVHAHSENTTDVFVGPTHAFSLERLLNERLPVFYTVDCGVLQGFSFFDPPEGALFDRNRIEIWDWNQLNADVCREYGPGNGRSIHDCVETFLMESAAHHVIYDHGTGEIADYLTLDTEDDRVRATLYHCKRSQERAAGSRLRDVSEVSSQAAKSVNWNSRRALLAAIERRMLRARGNSRFLRGELEQVRGMLMGDLRLSTRVVIVQPGLSQTALTDQAAAILGAADSLLFGQGFQRLAIIGSA